MADISKITAIDGTTYNIKDAVARSTLNTQAHIFYVVGPNTDSTAGTWTGSISGLTAYYDGLTVIYVPYTNPGTSVTTLNINSLGAKTCYSTNEEPLTSYHYFAGTPILLTYMNNIWRRADYGADASIEVIRL